MLDTYREIETPEGVELRLSVAGPVVRGIAWAQDLLIRSVVYIALSVGLSLFGEFGWGILLIALFLIEWFYPVWFEIYRHGATPGKRAFGICVVNDDGTPVDWSASIIRNLLRYVDFLPFLYGVGLISMLLRVDCKRLGDLAAGTCVVYRDNEKKLSSTPDAPARPLELEIALNLDEQRAVISFAERSNQLSVERSVELADILAPCIKNAPQDSVPLLYGLANWLLGKNR